MDNATSHVNEMAPFIALVTADPQFETCLVPVGNGEFLAVKTSMSVLPTFDNFIDGRWKPSRTGQTFENENPAFKGSNLGFFQSSSPDDIDEAIGAAESAFRAWRSHAGAGAPAVYRRSS